jgi:cytochrome oxidase Cu insertion factor (SCO1/SenC/PrrC family)
MKRTFGVLSALFLMLSMVACEGREHAGGEESLTTGERAPGFQLPSAGGEPVSLEDFSGKPVLLYFSMGPG